MTEIDEKQVRRDKIIEAATELFAEKGYHATSVNDIARQAGMTKGGIYWYFDSKRAIFMTILDEMIIANHEIWDEIERLSERLRPRELLRRGGKMFIEKLTKDKRLQRLYNEIRTEAMKDPDVRTKLFERISMGVDFIKKYFKDALDKGAVKASNTKRLSLCVIIMIMGLANANWMTARKIDPNVYWDEFVDDLFDGIEAKA